MINMQLSIFSLLLLQRSYLVDSSSCGDDEFLLQESSCEKCTDYISNCSTCSSGQYSPIQNGGFELPELTSTAGWAYLDTLEGWTVEPDMKVEINDFYYDIPHSGDQFIQLIADYNYYIYQDLVTESGYDYELELYYSASRGRNAAANVMMFYWGSNTDSVNPNGNGLSQNVWFPYSHTVTATGSTTRLKLEGAGNINWHGGHVDTITYKNLPKCTECESGFYVSSNSCVSCPAVDVNCSRCDDAGCVKCIDGLYLEGQICFSCPANCSKCTNYSSCTECNSNLPLSHGICGCYTGTDPSSTTCVSCTPFDANCSLCNDTECFACAGGFFFVNGSCSICPDNCTMCSDLDNCLGCTDGYYLSLGTCLACPSECSKCSSASNCLECQKEYVLQNGMCEKCEDTCLECSEFLECSRCIDGFFVDGVRCAECEARCLLCSSENECSECKDSLSLVEGRCECLSGEFLTEERCETCESVHENCSLCEENTCTACKQGFEVQNGSCVPSSEVETNTIGEYSGEEMGNASVSSAMMTTTIMSISSRSTFFFWNFLNLGIIIYYSPLMNTGMTKLMKAFCQSFNSDFLGLMPNFGELIGFKIEDYPETSADFQDYDIESTSFLLNSGEILFPFLIVLGFLPLIGISYLFFPLKFFGRKLKDYRWNFFVRSWIQMFVELLVNSLLCISTIDESTINVEQVISICIALFGVLTPFLLLFFLIKNRGSNDAQRYINFSSFFEEFKSGNVVLGLAYYFLFYLKRLLFVLGVFFLNERPLSQIIINLFTSLLVVVFLVCVRPYNTKIEECMSIFSEIAHVFVFIVCGLCLLDNSEETKKVLEFILIGIILFFIFLMFVLAVIQCIVSINSLRERKKKKYATVVSVLDQTTNVSTSANYRITNQGNNKLFEESKQINEQKIY